MVSRFNIESGDVDLVDWWKLHSIQVGGRCSLQRKVQFPGYLFTPLRIEQSFKEVRSRYLTAVVLKFEETTFGNFQRLRRCVESYGGDVLRAGILCLLQRCIMRTK